MIERIGGAIRLMRPRTIGTLQQRQDGLDGELARVRELAAGSAEAAERSLSDIRQLVDSALARNGADVRALLEQIDRRLQTIERRQEQLFAINRANTEQDARLATLRLDREATVAHVTAAIERAPLCTDPFPHLIVDGLLPADVYDLLLESIPPAELFSDRPSNKQQLPVPFEVAPTLSRRVWQFMADVIVDEAVRPATLAKLGDAVHDWLAHSFPGADLSDVPMRSTDGRLLRRTRGYVIKPHRDPQRGLVTCLLYLSKPGDDPSWGTQFYAVDEDGPARSASPHWIDSQRCRLVKDIPYVANRMLVWINSVGAHGASIPDTAPEGLVRYAYQFKLGPASKALNRLIERLPPERQRPWQRPASY